MRCGYVAKRCKNVREKPRVSTGLICFAKSKVEKTKKKNDKKKNVSQARVCCLARLIIKEGVEPIWPIGPVHSSSGLRASRLSAAGSSAGAILAADQLLVKTERARSLSFPRERLIGRCSIAHWGIIDLCYISSYAYRQILIEIIIAVGKENNGRETHCAWVADYWSTKRAQLFIKNSIKIKLEGQWEESCLGAS